MSLTKLASCDPVIVNILRSGSLRERYRWRRVCHQWSELVTLRTPTMRELPLIGAVRSQEAQEHALKYFIEATGGQQHLISLKLPYSISSELAQEIGQAWPNIESLTISSIFITELEPFGRLKWFKGTLSYGPADKGDYGDYDPPEPDDLTRYHGILRRLEGFECPAYIPQHLLQERPPLCGIRSLHLLVKDWDQNSRELFEPPYKSILARSVNELNAECTPHFRHVIGFEQLRSLRLHLNLPGMPKDVLRPLFKPTCPPRLESLVVWDLYGHQLNVSEVLTPLTGLKELMLPWFWYMSHENIVNIPKEAPISKLGLCLNPDCFWDVLVRRGYPLTELALKRSWTFSGVDVICITVDQVIGLLSALPQLKSLSLQCQSGIGDELFHQFWDRIPNLRFIGLEGTTCTAEGLAWFVEKRLEQISLHGQHQLPIIYVHLGVDWSLTTGAQRFAARVENYEPFVSISTKFTLAWPLDVFEL